jgi:hypothetical protein
MKHPFLIGLVILMTLSVYGQEKPAKPVGKIVVFTGRAYVKNPGKSRREFTAGDKNGAIYAEQELGCISKCSITFTIGQTEKTINKGPYIIPNLLKRRTPTDENITAGSKTRGSNGIIILPLERGIGVVRPESFKFKWRLAKNGKQIVNISPLTISLNGCNNLENFWSKADIDYKQIYFSSEDLRTRLKNKQKLNAAESVEVVVDSKSFVKKIRFCFNIISASEEIRLHNELKQWDDYSDLVKHVERAYVFEKYKLYSDAAEELEISLKLSSNDKYLLAEVIRIYSIIEDENRVRELKAVRGK